MRVTLLLLCVAALLRAQPVAQPVAQSYARRVDGVRKTPGFVALWDFVKREAQGGRFDAHPGRRERGDFRLDAVNYVRDYWGQGREASYADFPLLGRGPFGQAVQFRDETDRDFRPLLMIPRERLHDTGLDVKGPGRSVSMVVWLQRETGNHAIGGIWHEGTDLQSAAGPVKKVEKGKRQYALFAGLAANNGAVAVHVSENGGASFGDRFARNLAVVPEVMDKSWGTAGFSFDNATNTVTAYWNGKAAEFWIEHPENHPFFKWPYQGWVQAELAREPGTQAGENPNFARDQFYQPPEGKPLRRETVEARGEERVELQTFRFTKVRVTLRGKQVIRRELVALRANPFWFPHNLYSPATPVDGGPFTIGRVIHTSRNVGFTGWIGGVAVFSRALGSRDMARLAAIGTAAPLLATEAVPTEAR